MTEVKLPDGETGSAYFHRLLAETARVFSNDLAGARLPKDAKQFKKTYGDALCRFEAARIRSPKRLAIAQHLTTQLFTSLRLDTLIPGAPPALETRAASSETRLTAEVPFDGRLYRGKDVLPLLDKLFADHHMSAAAHQALRAIVDRINRDGLDLRGQRFALLGAGAELSPVHLLLQAGAKVLWVDTKQPKLDGHLVYNHAGDDLLKDPAAVLASLHRFADEGPIHLACLAYAPGASRELRVAAVMAAMAKQLGAKAASMSLLISPTSPGETQPDDMRVATERGPKWWQRGLDFARVLPRPGHYDNVARAIVSLQGPGYQAAQYLAKICAAEALAQDLKVSANVAGITNTKSLAHPLFQMAFVGAPQFGVRIFEPATTRALSGLLMLHDVLGEPVRDGAALRAKQIHGGVYDLPWQFESCVKVAAVLGWKALTNLKQKPVAIVDPARG